VGYGEVGMLWLQGGVWWRQGPHPPPTAVPLLQREKAGRRAVLRWSGMRRLLVRC